MRCAYCTTLRKWNESAVRTDPKKRTSRSRTLCAKIARKKLQNFRNILARRVHRSCVHSACVAKKSNAISEAFEQITSALPSKKRAVGVEITQSFAQKSRERIAEFLEIRRAARTIFASNRSVCVTQTSELRCSCLQSRQSVQMQKTRECSSREHANFP